MVQIYNIDLKRLKYKDARVLWQNNSLTLGRTSRFIPPPFLQGGGGMEPLPGVFVLLT